MLLTPLWILLSSVCYANVHGHSDCNGLRCPSLPVGIIPLALGILKEEPETLGLQWDSDHASGSDEVRSTVCALRLPVLEGITWENCSACPAPARAAPPQPVRQYAPEPTAASREVRVNPPGEERMPAGGAGVLQGAPARGRWRTKGFGIPSR